MTIVAIILFGGFHLLPFGDGGWWVWPKFWALWRDPAPLSEPMVLLFFAAFLGFTPLILGSPFLVSSASGSYLLRLVLRILSGLTAFALVLSFVKLTIGDLSAGDFCLIEAAGANFIGLLLLRGEQGMSQARPTPASSSPGSGRIP